ncbi:hypothetical protein ACIP6P_32540 [Streptomyces sp. NPDC088729]|uniref:hypothetical protein n=1 Tax=Streptomyces sp. NPDC088729 TaxID=3365876 RepID=UPI00382C2220
MGDPVTPKASIRSDACGLLELACTYDDSPFRGRLRLGDGWTRRWSGTWLVGEGQVTWPVRDMAGVPVLSSQPVRGFTWRARQGHRPGLQYMVSTGRHHGFESLEEQRLLVVLDFLRVAEVLPQPFTLDLEHVHGRARHTPDFLAVLRRTPTPWPKHRRALEVAQGNRTVHMHPTTRPLDLTLGFMP